MKKLIYILLFLSLQTLAFSGNSDREKASSRTVSGRVTDTYGETLAGAQVIVAETGETVFADMDGNFRLTLKTDKVYSITINSIGFAPLKVKSNSLSAFSDLSLNSL